MPDRTLWRRAAEEHDGWAFGELFDRHAARVHSHCFRRTLSWSIAEDLTSVVFLEAWRRRKDVRFGGDSVLPWLLAVANNCLRNAERSRRRYRRLLAKLPRSLEEPADDVEVASRLDDRKTMERLRPLIEKLRREEQEVIGLCDWSGLSCQEASTALGIPEGTVKSRLSRARAHLRELVGAEKEDRWAAVGRPRESEGR